jgi:hypothetical protein
MFLHKLCFYIFLYFPYSNPSFIYHRIIYFASLQFYIFQNRHPTSISFENRTSYLKFASYKEELSFMQSIITSTTTVQDQQIAKFSYLLSKKSAV